MDSLSYCQTCNKEISANEEDFHCFTCGCRMHLNEKCTQLSKTAISGIKELGQNALLICNNCVALKKRDKLIETACKIQQQAPIEDKKFKSLQTEVNDIKKAITDLKVSFEQMSSEPPKLSPPIIKTTNTAKEFDGIRIRGLQESDAEGARERNEKDMSEVKAMLNFLEIDCEITELRRIGQQGNRNRTLVFKVANRWHRSLILLSVAKLKNYSQQLFVSRELNATEAKLEMEILKKRKEIIENGTNRTHIRIRDL